ncbi:hypothetical protein FBF71_26115 [Bradyrhizobium elkanii]|nr:hypothetical protein [Bradyrhizobium elkanii]NWL69898.1 hypothetical protein [Bradyrhizobium elkanii]RYM24004.1 hypothetical protein EWH13_17965 [Bradyrhizobium elkanii]
MFLLRHPQAGFDRDAAPSWFTTPQSARLRILFGGVAGTQQAMEPMTRNGCNSAAITIWLQPLFDDGLPFLEGEAAARTLAAVTIAMPR